MDFFDSHCHLTDPRFAGELDVIAERARDAGVRSFVTVASDEDDAAAALGVARRLGVWSTAGIHPHAADRAPAGLGRVRDLLAEPEVVAVGETGLDYYYDNASREAQRSSFEAQLDLAAATGMPVVVHSRDSDEDLIAMIRAASPDVRGVLHCFAGSPALFEAGVALGWYVSFSGLLTFPSYATRELAGAVPPDRLLIETDAPYLAPVPHRGKRNEPALVVEVARAVATITGESLDAVAARTTFNAREFYGVGGSHA
ncbi:MAG TPA: TatD family hydrolase [Longimicrobiales bacterium]|nr:TatD family hydrolase [Longimicrobiales bacterium]